ncbi:MAG: undecaprenyl/decaprenyl-phosphate alpha-N-acetylglucosaminyl 1-phosphate transferase [Ruminococcaceae bacterium]|nr:undecaprenyl/decaprenyl-phosphate alpha-N-acetylglucosaminyl 1-phosphate transferase [Oscillospiraceae bacterium]
MAFKVFLACFFALAVGFFLTFPIKKLARTRGFMDVPDDERRMHNEPIPRIGGLAIYLAFSAALFVTGKPSEVLPYVFAFGIVAALGVIDDRYSLHAPIKIAGQAVAGLSFCFLGITVDNIRLFGLDIETGVMAYPLTVIFAVASINVFNLIDGLDGLCCGLSVIAACGLVLLTSFAGASEITLTALIFVFACMGFLPHNVRFARIFMGDTGSMLCGAALAAICCKTVFSEEYGFSALTVIALLGIPIFDTALAISRRIRNKTGVFTGDKEHVHHRLSARYGHGNTVLLMYAGGILLTGIAIIINYAPLGEIFGAFMLLLCAAYGTIRFGVDKN